LVSQHGIRIIIVDYLQLMTAGGNSKGGGNREQETSEFKARIKPVCFYRKVKRELCSTFVQRQLTIIAVLKSMEVFDEWMISF
jgi:hypothetical protein